MQNSARVDLGGGAELLVDVSSSNVAAVGRRSQRGSRSCRGNRFDAEDSSHGQLRTGGGLVVRRRQVQAGGKEGAAGLPTVREENGWCSAGWKALQQRGGRRAEEGSDTAVDGGRRRRLRRAMLALWPATLRGGGGRLRGGEKRRRGSDCLVGEEARHGVGGSTFAVMEAVEEEEKARLEKRRGRRRRFE